MGLASGLSMVAMHQIITAFSMSFMIADVESFEQLPSYLRALIPLTASLILILIFIILPAKFHSLGVIYVMEQLNHHKGNLSIRKAFVQFLSAIIGLIGGLSIGKEGPAVHIGSTFGSKVAEYGRLTLQSKETLIACGAAGAISAAFQTPLSGILFTLEVIFLGYQTITILPVILSSVTAMAISQWLLGPISLFHFDGSTDFIFNLDNFGALLVLSIGVALLAGIFYRIQKALWSYHSTHVAWRFLVVGIVTALCAFFVPETLGIGYDSLEKLLAGESLTNLIIVILLLKIFLTALSTGLGIPGGLIGPSFIIGSFAGIQVALWYFTNPSIELISLFALLGMATMMSTILQAPLAGLIGIIEIYHSSSIILPAMFVIGIACVFARTVLKQNSVFVERLKKQRLYIKTPHERLWQYQDIDILTQPLERISTLVSWSQIEKLQLSMIEYAIIQREAYFALVKVESITDLLKMSDNNDLKNNKDNEQEFIDLLNVLDSMIIQLFTKAESLENAAKHLTLSDTPFVLIEGSHNSEIRLLKRQHFDQFLLKR